MDADITTDSRIPENSADRPPPHGRIPGPAVWQLPWLGLSGPRRPHELAQKLHDRYGPVVKLGIGASQYVYLFGEEANRLVLSDRGNAFTWKEAVKPLEPVVGPKALVLSDGVEHRRRRRLVQSAFATRRIDAAVPTVTAEVDRMIEALPIGKPTDLHASFRKALRRIVVRVLFGDARPGLADELGEILEPAVRFVDRTVELQSLDPVGRARARRARNRADQLVDAEISRRQRVEDLGGDVLGSLLGTELDRAEITDQVVSLIAAGYETTSAAIAWTILELLAHPSELQRCQAEIASVMEDQPPSPAQLRSMPLTIAIINETLRLWPPTSVLGRRVIEPVSYLEHVIPAGTTLLISPYVTHRCRTSWGPDSNEFRPARWHNCQPPEERFFPFGGAYRHCLGFALALTEIQVGLIRLLQRVTIRAALPATLRGRGLSALRPDNGAVVILDSRH